MKIIVMAGGSVLNPHAFKSMISRADRVVCADGGAAHLAALDIVPHVVMGDLDSIDLSHQRNLEDAGVEFIRHPVDKDYTDTELAARWAVENGASHITFMGTTGTRMDHTLANVFLMEKIAAMGVACSMVDAHNEIHLIRDEISLEKRPDTYLSIIPISEKVTGITLTGLAFPLTNATLHRGDSTGISNRFKASRATIRIKTGILMVTLSND
ncbi:thiamine diphosphokinase [Desulfocicer vacuolatum DSM 3385]|uniref:Thiamine diphosphokinase n=1 Tax=Desulfocicer vacuolatum DSM 3385 TaxID=1121400 RepID=A0A1W1Z8B9_9BACT|nr:thiamine diphosphokinase [Desulfocicer vacuolatum]SMC44401.1 thiamine diphosphokinase [Desulfocicer vacuolatum DSM 3385]